MLRPFLSMQDRALIRCSQEAVDNNEVRNDADGQKLGPSLSGFLEEWRCILDNLVDGDVHEEVDFDVVGGGRSTRNILLMHIEITSGIQMINWVDEGPGALLRKDVRKLVFGREADVSLNFAEAEVFTLDQIQTSLCRQPLHPIWSLKLVDKSDLHVGINEFVEGVDDSLQNSHIPNFGAIRIHTNLDFNLINIAIVVGIVIQKLNERC